MLNRIAEFASAERIQRYAWIAFLYVSILLERFVARLQPALAIRSRSRAQTLVEWSLVAAVMAFVGVAAWQLAGTAITQAIDRTIVSLGRAGA